jgi:hypothetical protein
MGGRGRVALLKTRRMAKPRVHIAQCLVRMMKARAAQCGAVGLQSQV